MFYKSFWILYQHSKWPHAILNGRCLALLHPWEIVEIRDKCAQNTKDFNAFYWANKRRTFSFKFSRFFSWELNLKLKLQSKTFRVTAYFHRIRVFFHIFLPSGGAVRFKNELVYDVTRLAHIGEQLLKDFCAYMYTI